jgi:hypothetical protein
MTLIYYLHKGDNIPFYIGKTVQSLDKRLARHKQNFGKILIEEIDRVSDNDWKFWECHYIGLFKSWGFSLTNKNAGGGGSTKQSLETINKRSIKLRKPKPRGFGDKVSFNRNHKLAAYKSWLSNQQHYKLGSQRNLKISNKLKGRTLYNPNTTGQPINQFNLKGELLDTFPSIRQAGLKLNKNAESIRRCVLDQYKTAHGYIWKYKN